MRDLDTIDIKTCRAQAKLFELSLKNKSYSSLIFIRRFMNSNIAKVFDSKHYIFTYLTLDETLDLIDEEYGNSEYGNKKYNPNQMYWIGYIYRCLSIRYNLSSKKIYKLFNGAEIIKYYNICHTMDPSFASDYMMKSIHYNSSLPQDKALNLMRDLRKQDKLKDFIGHDVSLVLDKDHNSNSLNKVYLVASDEPIEDTEKNGKYSK